MSVGRPTVCAVNAVQTYRYLQPSTLGAAGLDLQTCGGPAANPRFFSGFLTTPAAAAAGLLAVAEVARTRYHQPVSPASLDPVVTGSRDRLRFESFSGCCGVYARMDVLPAGFDGEVAGHGTPITEEHRYKMIPAQKRGTYSAIRALSFNFAQ
ncbi:hypothetical protein, partial [Staphylococcus capitis]|uniref:hypothetical protein n=1 Tax=Staphylococcus capitis TaxID=29388 RepID=UPI003CFF2CBC